MLQRKPQPPGSVSRIAAAEIEALVITALRKHLQANPTEAQPTPDNERELVEHYVERLTLGPKHIKLQLRQSIGALEARNAPDDRSHSPAIPIASGTITIPWTRAVPAAVKGIIHVPAHNTPMKPSRREALLTAIAKARKWIDDLMYGHATSLAAIARREGMVERHVRLLLQLAFVSPRIVSALLDGTAPADPTVTTLARGLPYSWAEQERRVGTQSHATTPASPP